MATLRERQLQGLVEAGLGIKLRDKERANRGISQFISIGITLIDLERLMDEAESEDAYTQYYDEEEATITREEKEEKDGS